MFGNVTALEGLPVILTNSKPYTSVRHRVPQEGGGCASEAPALNAPGH